VLKITIGSAKHLLGKELSAISKEEPVANSGVVPGHKEGYNL
jgi:hypothetical protein